MEQRDAPAPATGLDPIAAFRLRTIRIGLLTTVAALAALVVFRLLPGHGRLDARWFGIVGVAAIGAAVVGVLPWGAMLAGRTGVAAMYVWSLFDIALISVAVAISGGARSDVYLLYALTTVFFAASYPVRGQLSLLAVTLGAYVAVLGLSGWDIGAAALFLRLSSIALVAVLGGFLSRELMAHVVAFHEKSLESDRRAVVLAAVAEAGRAINALDPDVVLRTVVESASSLGLEAANLAVIDEESGTYRVEHAIGLPAEYARSVRSLDRGMPALVRSRGATVVVEDYADRPEAVEVLRSAGFHAVVASPIWVGPRLVAILVGGTRARRSVTPDEVNAFELLAAQAGTALSNAERFADERRTVERLGEVDRMKGEFLSMVSHELRTPLTVIEGMGLTLERNWDDLDEATRLDLLGRLNANAESLERIMTSLLDFSAFDAGRAEARMDDVDVGQAVDGAVRRLAPLLAQHDVTVAVEPRLVVRADPVLIERVVENLLSNAAKHTPPGTPVHVSALRVGGDAEVAVADGGPGIGADELGRIGERFFRGGDPNSRAAKGLGLGLALVREVLALHASSLQTESAPGEGARFSFQLPLTRPRASRSDALPARSANEAAPETRPERPAPVDVRTRART